MIESDETLENVIKEYRKNLLDITHRNKLINFTHNNRSKKFIRFVDEVPSLIFDFFATQDKAMKVKSLPGLDDPKDENTEEFKNALNEKYQVESEDFETEEEYAKYDRKIRDSVRAELGMPPLPAKNDVNSIANLHGINPDYNLPSVSNGEKKHQGNTLQTLYSAQELNRRLSLIHNETQTNENDKGINTLYLAFGFLEWYEKETASTKLSSPIILLPMMLESKINSRGKSFTLSATGRATLNKCLCLKLEDSIELKLPDLKFNDEGKLEESIEEYFIQIEKNIDSHPKWKVRRFITLTNLHFNKVVMYEDLDSKRWEKTPLSSIPTIGSVFWGKDRNEEFSDDKTTLLSKLEDYDIDECSYKDPLNDLLIKEADSSQHSAILDAMKGNDLVVVGPPGTGKSQTITNLIAQALAREKKVLFMCEKLPALKVVKNRLDHCKFKTDSGIEFSLGDFCFELHSNSSKKNLHKEMENRLKIENGAVDIGDYHTVVKGIKNKRRELRAFSDLLNQRIGNSEYNNYYDAVWAYENLYRTYGENYISRLRFSVDPKTWTPDDVSRIIDNIKLYETQCTLIQKSFADLCKHPWKWVTKSGLGKIDQKSIVDLVLAIKKTLDGIILTLNKISDEIPKLDVISSKTFENIRNFIVTNIPDIDLKILKRFENEAYLPKILSELKTYDIYLDKLKNMQEYTDQSDQIRAKIENKNIDEILSNIRDFKEVLPPQNLKDINDEYKCIQENKDALKYFLELSKCFSQLFQYGDSVNKEFSLIGLKTLESVLNEIKQIDPSFFSFILSGISDEKTYKSEWKYVYRESIKIEDDIRRLPYNFDVCELEAANGIVEHSNNLEHNTFIFKWLFSAEAKSAKSILYKICPSAKKFSKENKIKCLKEMATLWSKLDAIKCKQIISTAGILNILKSDGTSKLREYNRILDKIWHILLSNPNYNTLISKIFQLSEADLLRLIDEFDEESADSSIAILSSDKSLNDDKNLYQIETELCEREAYLKNIIGLAGSIYLKDSIPVSDIHHLYKICDEAEKSFAKIDELFDFLKLYKEKTKEILTNFAKYIEIRDALTNDDSLKSHLLDKDFYIELTSKLKSYLEEFDTLQTDINHKLVDINALAGGVPVIFESCEITPEICNQETKDYLNNLCASFDMLGEYCDLNNYGERIKADGVFEPINNALTRGISPENFSNIFKMVYLYTLLDFPDKTGIKQIAEIEKLQNDFKELDNQLYQANIKFIAQKLTSCNVNRGIHVGYKSNYSEISLVKNEVSKKNRHLPIRQYLSQALSTVLKLKPCFMMSPQTVSQYLPANAEMFDLLIIDEASQMLPADTIPALARAKQVVIVGDKQQLPPTNFFSSSISSQNEEIEDGESILDIADGRLRKRMLTWHYRSRHESLINFSNINFYDGNLIVFPSKEGRNSNELGIKYHYVENGFFENGVNKEEADMLVSVLPEIIENNPNKSIGIVAMNQKQAELLREKVDQLIEENEFVQDYVDEWESKLEEFFIKNLENVQGDERDIIIISFVYGKTTNTDKVSQNFGPINKENGYRRLNVLFSRAKEQIVVFTSMKYSDVRISELNNKVNSGPIALKKYLEYAANEGCDASKNDEAEPVNDFEKSIGKFLEGQEFLKQKGDKVKYQVGASGYFIDIVIDSPLGKHLLGIECDGAQYHSSKSARDRDKLRQSQLESLGWNFYRVWSTDWFHDRSVAEKRLLDAVKKVCC